MKSHKVGEREDACLVMSTSLMLHQQMKEHILTGQDSNFKGFRMILSRWP